MIRPGEQVQDRTPRSRSRLSLVETRARGGRELQNFDLLPASSRAGGRPGERRHSQDHGGRDHQQHAPSSVQAINARRDPRHRLLISFLPSIFESTVYGTRSLSPHLLSRSGSVDCSLWCRAAGETRGRGASFVKGRFPPGHCREVGRDEAVDLPRRDAIGQVNALGRFGVGEGRGMPCSMARRVRSGRRRRPVFSRIRSR